MPKFINGNVATWTMRGDWNRKEVFKFDEGHGNDRIVRFDINNDLVDLTEFNQEISWDDLQHKITLNTWWMLGREVTDVTIDLTDWGGGVIELPKLSGRLGLQNEVKDMIRIATVGGDEGNNFGYGTYGDDVIAGRGGHDSLTGLGGDDYLTGGAGHDQLNGSGGDDRLNGGAGNDTFFYNKNAGHDTIEDFQSGKDRIELSNYTHITEFSQLSASQEGGNVVIDMSSHGGGSITLENFDLDDLSADDFSFYGG